MPKIEMPNLYQETAYIPVVLFYQWFNPILLVKVLERICEIPFTFCHSPMNLPISKSKMSEFEFFSAVKTEENATIFLIDNHGSNGSLLPAKNKVDYVLIIDHETDNFNTSIIFSNVNNNIENPFQKGLQSNSSVFSYPELVHFLENPKSLSPMEIRLTEKYRSSIYV